jgi:hypothetical protein
MHHLPCLIPTSFQPYSIRRKIRVVKVLPGKELEKCKNELEKYKVMVYEANGRELGYKQEMNELRKEADRVCTLLNHKSVK